MFDLLTNQKADPEEDKHSAQVWEATDPSLLQLHAQLSRKHDAFWLCSQGSRTTSSTGSIEEVKEILKKLELSDYCDVFEKEKMDRQALVRSSPVLLAFVALCFSSPSSHHCTSSGSESHMKHL